ncbi:hypothetical protein ACJX0J_007481, partial [Zea mays]
MGDESIFRSIIKTTYVKTHAVFERKNHENLFRPLLLIFSITLFGSVNFGNNYGVRSYQILKIGFNENSITLVSLKIHLLKKYIMRLIFGRGGHLKIRLKKCSQHFAYIFFELHT